MSRLRFNSTLYFATAYWLIGYADSMDPERHAAVIKKLREAAEMLLAVHQAEERS